MTLLTNGWIPKTRCPSLPPSPPPSTLPSPFTSITSASFVPAEGARQLPLPSTLPQQQPSPHQQLASTGKSALSPDKVATGAATLPNTAPQLGSELPRSSSGLPIRSSTTSSSFFSNLPSSSSMPSSSSRPTTLSLRPFPRPALPTLGALRAPTPSHLLLFMNTLSNSLSTNSPPPTPQWHPNLAVFCSRAVATGATELALGTR